jgi:hypothetical protein
MKDGGWRAGVTALVMASHVFTIRVRHPIFSIPSMTSNYFRWLTIFLASELPVVRDASRCLFGVMAHLPHPG